MAEAESVARLKRGIGNKSAPTGADRITATEFRFQKERTCEYPYTHSYIRVQKSVCFLFTFTVPR